MGTPTVCRCFPETGGQAESLRPEFLGYDMHRKIKCRVRKMSVAERAYIAGFLDGDGTIIIGKRKCDWTSAGESYRPDVVFSNTCRDALVTISNMIGTGSVGEATVRGRNIKQLYRLRISSQQAKYLLQQIGEYLVIKKDQARLVLEHYDLLDEGKHCGNFLHGFRDIYYRMRVLNARYSHNKRLAQEVN